MDKNKDIETGIILLIVDIKMKFIFIEKLVPDQTAATLLPYQTPVEILYSVHEPL